MRIEQLRDDTRTRGPDWGPFYEGELRMVCQYLATLVPFFILVAKGVADAICIFVAFSFIFHSIKCKNYKWGGNPLAWFIVIWGGWLLVTPFFAYSNKAEVFLYTVAFFRHPFFCLACITWLFRTKEEMYFAAKVILICLVVASLDALWQFYTGVSLSGRPKFGERLTGILRRPNIGIFITKLMFPVMGMMVYYNIQKNKKTTHLLWVIPIFILLITTVFLTGERSATLLLLLSMSFLVFFIGCFVKYMGRLMLPLFLFTPTVLGVLIIEVDFIGRRTEELAKEMDNFFEGVYGQLFYAATRMWREYGLFTGVGLKKFEEACIDLKNAGHVTYCSTHPHNIYLEIFAETGMVGGMLFFMLPLYVLHVLIDNVRINYHPIPLGFLIAGYITVLFPASVTMSFFSNWSAMLNWTSLALCGSMAVIYSKTE